MIHDYTSFETRERDRREISKSKHRLFDDTQRPGFSCTVALDKNRQATTEARRRNSMGVCFVCGLLRLTRRRRQKSCVCSIGWKRIKIPFLSENAKAFLNFCRICRSRNGRSSSSKFCTCVSPYSSLFHRIYMLLCSHFRRAIFALAIRPCEAFLPRAKLKFLCRTNINVAPTATIPFACIYYV